MLKVKRTLHKIGLSHPSQRLLLCCITGKTALPHGSGLPLTTPSPQVGATECPERGSWAPQLHQVHLSLIEANAPAVYTINLFKQDPSSSPV